MMERSGPQKAGRGASAVEDVKQAMRKWLADAAADFNDPIFFTALFKDRAIGQLGDIIHLTPDIARREIKRFANRIDRAILGAAVKRFNLRIRRIPVLEYGVDRGWHCHMLIERPERVLQVRFRHILQTEWARSPWATGFHVRAGDPGAVGYLTKEHSKAELEVWSDTIVTEAMVLTTK